MYCYVCLCYVIEWTVCTTSVYTAECSTGGHTCYSGQWVLCYLAINEWVVCLWCVMCYVWCVMCDVMCDVWRDAWWCVMFYVGVYVDVCVCSTTENKCRAGSFSHGNIQHQSSAVDVTQSFAHRHMYCRLCFNIYYVLWVLCDCLNVWVCECSVNEYIFLISLPFVAIPTIHQQTDCTSTHNHHTT